MSPTSKSTENSPREIAAIRGEALGVGATVLREANNLLNQINACTDPAALKRASRLLEKGLKALKGSPQKTTPIDPATKKIAFLEKFSIIDS